MFFRAIARPLMARVKQNAREVYSKTLKEVKAVPEDEGYRKAVESFTRQRLQVCCEEEDWEVVEEARIGKMIEWDPWGVPYDYECEVIENDTPVPKHVPIHRPGPLPEEFYKMLQGISSDQTKLDEAKPTTLNSESET